MEGSVPGMYRIHDTTASIHHFTSLPYPRPCPSPQADRHPHDQLPGTKPCYRNTNKHESASFEVVAHILLLLDVLLLSLRRLIDIPMTSCLQSTINKVYVVTQYNSQSLNRWGFTVAPAVYGTCILANEAAGGRAVQWPGPREGGTKWKLSNVHYEREGHATRTCRSPRL